MPQLTINGTAYSFEKGKTILQVALDNGFEIPHYCYHDSLSIPANCRICLAEVGQPNPKTGALEWIPKLMPTCHTMAADGMVIRTDSDKAVANQKAVMEYLLINHPVDCAVCDQAGECHLQDYSYEYGRSESRFQEEKIKNPKKDVGPNILLYSDRCIMCTRCVRFTREVTQTNELMVEGRGGTEMIDVFPGMALDNELAGNVVDLCPVGALLDKKFLFQQRVWFLKSTPSIDGITSSGDNITVDHNEGRVYRIRPRTNMEVNQWWITDEVRHGWEFVHREDRLSMPAIRGAEAFAREDAAEAWLAATDRAARVLREGAAAGSLAFVASPMMSCEDAYLLAREVLSLDPNAALVIGPVPVSGADKTFPNGFVVRAEKAPNARGVRRVLEAMARTTAGRTAGATVHDAVSGLAALTSAGAGTVLLTGNYPSEWITPEWAAALGTRRVVMLETLPNRMTAAAEVLLPAATWVEKAGTFENAKGRLQGFDRAIEPIDFCKSESQIALDLRASLSGGVAAAFDAAAVRAEMARIPGLECFATAHHPAPAKPAVKSDMTLIEL
jgi:NADH-quinone oxidoreductase subunit G